MPFLKLYILENLVGWKCLNEQNWKQWKLGKYAANIQMSLGKLQLAMQFLRPIISQMWQTSFVESHQISLPNLNW